VKKFNVWFVFVSLALFFGCASKSKINSPYNSSQNSSTSSALSSQGGTGSEQIPFERHLCSYNSPLTVPDGNQKQIKSCESKNKDCYKAGLYAERIGHFSQAQKFFKIACDQNSAESCYCLAQSKMTGDMTSEPSQEKKDLAIIQILTKSCQSGHRDSCAFIDYSLYIGRKDSAAIDRIQTGCAQGSTRSCYYNGIIQNKNGNLQLAEQFLKKACDKKYAPACGDLALLYQSDSADDALDKSDAFSKKACMMGKTEFCESLPVIAEDWIKPHVKFCKMGFFDSCMTAMKSRKKSTVQAARKTVCKLETVLCNENDKLSKGEFDKRYASLKKNSLACVSDVNIKVISKRKQEVFAISRCIK